ncbi:MAG: DUF805 domain-containing protein [Deltaproteobacteria bacterium]|nr:DUF805 domain-containing protein [Deltaproteobacteria bacterium]
MSNNINEKNPFDYFADVFKKYAVFNGRSRRAEYWYFALFSTIISILLEIISFFVLKNLIIVYLYDLAVLIPGLAVSIRRVHDIGKSGWFILINLIPIVGFIIWIVYMATDSQPGENKYGQNPKI